MSLDIIFVNAASSATAFQELSNTYSAIETPTWALLLAESCRSKGFNVGILDAEAEHLSDEEVLHRIKNCNPTFVCFVVYGGSPNAGTTCMIGAARTAAIIPEEYTRIFVGSHISALPKQVLAETFVDIVLTNEGVYALHDLLGLTRNNPDWKLKLGQIKGIGFKSGGNLILNPYSEIVPQERMDVDLPGYAWDLLPYKSYPLDLYRSHYWHSNFDDNQRTPFAAIYTSLGCVHSCGFCMINIVNRTDPDDTVNSSNSRVMRFWSTKWVEKVLTQLAMLDVRTLKFSDELFFYDPKRYRPILDVLRNMSHNFNIWCYARVDTVRVNDLPLFKSAGINWLCLGIESGNRTVRKEISKGSYQDVRVETIVHAIQEAGMFVLANYIFGLPEDTYETMEDTLNLSLNMITEHANFYTCVALPGSPLYTECLSSGIDVPLPNEYDKFAFLSYNHQPLPSKYCSSQDILRFRDYAWTTYFENEAYLKFVKDRLGEIAASNVRNMSKIKLKRALLNQ